MEVDIIMEKVYQIVYSYAEDWPQRYFDGRIYELPNMAYRIMCEEAFDTYVAQQLHKNFDLEYHPEWNGVQIYEIKNGTRKLYADFHVTDLIYIPNPYND